MIYDYARSESFASDENREYHFVLRWDRKGSQQSSLCLTGRGGQEVLWVEVVSTDPCKPQ